MATEQTQPDETGSVIELPLTDEQYAAKLYMELGRHSSDYDLERKNLKDKEIEVGMASGLVYEYGGKMLTWEFETRVTFDYLRAYNDKVLTQDHLDTYANVKVIRKLVARNLKDNGEAFEEQFLQGCMALRRKMLGLDIPTEDL